MVGRLALAGSSGKISLSPMRRSVVLISTCFCITAICLGHLCIVHLLGLYRPRPTCCTCSYASFEAGDCSLRTGLHIQYWPHFDQGVRPNVLRPCVQDGQKLPDRLLDRGLYASRLVYCYGLCLPLDMQPDSKELGFVCPRSLPQQAG